MANNTITTFDYALKKLYPQKEVEKSLMSEVSPFFKLMPKSQDFYGASRALKVQYAGNMAGSNYSKVNSNTKAMQGVEFVITRAKEYALPRVDREAVMASMNIKGAVGKLVQEAIDDGIRNSARYLSRGVWGSTTNSISTIGSSTNTATTTLYFNSADDMVHIEKGDILVFSAADGGALRSSTGLTINNVQYDAGTVTLSATPDSLSASIAAGDYIYKITDHDASGTSAEGIAGMSSWCPVTAPTAGDSFFGVDRSVSDIFLAGSRFVGTGYTNKEAIIKAATKLSRFGFKASHCFVNPSKYEALTMELEANVRYAEVKSLSHKEFSVESIVLNTAFGPIPVIADPYCPTAYGYLVNLPDIAFESLGPAPALFEENGRTHVLEDEDAYIIKMGMYGNLVCKKPCNNCVITMP